MIQSDLIQSELTSILQCIIIGIAIFADEETIERHPDEDNAESGRQQPNHNTHIDTTAVPDLWHECYH